MPKRESNTQLLPPSVINPSSTQGVLRLPWILLLDRPFLGRCPELPRHVASRDSFPTWQRAQRESRLEAAEATPRPLFSSFPGRPLQTRAPLRPPTRRLCSRRVAGLPASSKPTGDWLGFPARGRIGGASGRRAPPPGGLPSAASYTLQPPSFLAEESEALRPAAVPHRMPSRRCRSSSSHSKPKPRPGSRIRAARAEWGLGGRGLAGRSSAAWEARAMEGTKTAITLAAAESPPRKGEGPGRVWTPSQSAWPLGRLSPPAQFEWPPPAAEGGQSPPSGAPGPAPRHRRRHTPGLSRAPIGRSLGRPASCGDCPWRHFRQHRRVPGSSWECFCSVGPWPD